MSKYCLIKPLAKLFKEKLKSGEINPETLSEMTSKERHEFFAEFLGETNAKNINSLFESKLLLKNQKQGMVTWAKTATGIKPELKQDLIARIGKMDKVLNPKQEEDFLQDLASTRLGTDVSFEEAQKITELSNKIKELENFTTDKERIEYGKARLELGEYVNSISPTKANLITNIANLPRSVVASGDLSAPFNQGWGMLSRKQFYTAFGSMFKYAKSKKALNELQADIITRPTYKTAQKAGLRLTEISNKLEKREEQFMSNLIDKIPGFSASQRAYVGFLNKLRIDVFDDLLKKAEIAGEDVATGSKAAEDIAKVVNDFTGGARVSKLEGATPILNAAFFSPRKIASTLNILNPVNYINPKISPTARKAALRNLIGSLAITGTVIKLADVLGGEKVKMETDTRSSDFGKIRVGDTTLDLSGGNSSYIVLASRLYTKSTKSSTTGIIKPLGDKVGETSGAKLIGNALRYKLSPNASLLVDAIVGSNALGEKKTIPESVIDRFRPMFLNSLYDLVKSDTDYKFQLATGALFGAGLQTFSFEDNWNESEGVELKQLKEKIGQEAFDEANEKYNKDVQELLKVLQDDKKYQSLSNEEKQKNLTKEKDKIKKDIFKSYNFKYKKPK